MAVVPITSLRAWVCSCAREVGLDSWALMPRLLAMALVGLLLLLPSIRGAERSSRWIVAVPAITSLAIIGVAVVRTQTAESGLPSAARVAVAPEAPTDWRHWGNNLAGTRYAAIDQINLGNVGSLKQVWHYASDIKAGALRSLEAPPLAVDGRLYMCIESGTVDALDQDTGKRLWRYRALPENSPYLGWKCRGVAYYAAKSQQPDCQRRLFLTTSTGQLIAIDADTGLPCSRFANAGVADLKDGMGVMKPDAALPTSPPTVINGVVVVGQSISDFGSFDSPSGVIRGYDAETGELRWAWDAGRPGQTRLKAGETYTRDTPNAWGVFSGDESLGLVYVGTGNSPPDYFAGYRSQISDEFTDNVVAIDVATGELRWSFKTVNHDLWDYDIAAQSVLVDLPGNVPALIVPTKRGQLFVLDRRTGQPIDPVVQRPVPQGGVEGNWTAATQLIRRGLRRLPGTICARSTCGGSPPSIR